MNSFHRSTINEWAETRPEISDPRPEWKRKFEESVASIHQTIKEKESEEDKKHESVSFGRKKKSRWAD